MPAHNQVQHIYCWSLPAALLLYRRDVEFSFLLSQASAALACAPDSMERKNLSLLAHTARKTSRTTGGDVMPLQKTLHPLLLLASIGLIASPLCAQDYPVKAIRIITSEPGGGNDFAARLLAPSLSAGL